jgi:hypothetical protein
MQLEVNQEYWHRLCDSMASSVLDDELGLRLIGARSDLRAHGFSRIWSRNGVRYG